MALAPGHRFGQIIGDMLEEAVYPILSSTAKKHGLYLDRKHSRKARDGKKLVKWLDYKGNSHDLDFVYEVGGTDSMFGRPKAFIEIAYRRYTKHSRNKAQEIQGAIMPLAETYRDFRPFLGAILAGVFTENSITQLRSHGFGVLYFPFNSIVKSFKAAGIDAYFDEQTADAEIQKKITAYKALDQKKKKLIASRLRKIHKDDIEAFLQKLDLAFSRTIERILVLALHGGKCESGNLQEAINFINGYDENKSVNGFVRYEVSVRYNNGDEVRGIFETKSRAIQFLNTMK